MTLTLILSVKINASQSGLVRFARHVTDSGKLVDELSIALVTDDAHDVGRLDRVDVGRSCVPNMALMLSGTHTPVYVEALRTHPAADKHNHLVVYSGRMKCRSKRPLRKEWKVYQSDAEAAPKRDERVDRSRSCKCWWR